MGENVGYTGGEGYLAAPAAGSGPALIVIREQWSLPHIRTLADRFAEAGFVALALDLNTADPGAEPPAHIDVEPQARIDGAVADIDAGAAFLCNRTGTETVAVVGSGTGGSLAVWSAGRCHAVGSAVAFYPRLACSPADPDWSGFEGKRILVHSAAAPGGTPPAGPGALSIDRLQAAVEAAGGKCVRYDYPGSDHAFFNDDRPEVYDADAAAVAWARTLDFLRV
jgi:carboxymethylenebutenolidase